MTMTGLFLFHHKYVVSIQNLFFMSLCTYMHYKHDKIQIINAYLVLFWKERAYIYIYCMRLRQTYILFLVISFAKFRRHMAISDQAAGAKGQTFVCEGESEKVVCRGTPSSM